MPNIIHCELFAYHHSDLSLCFLHTVRFKGHSRSGCECPFPATAMRGSLYGAIFKLTKCLIPTTHLLLCRQVQVPFRELSVQCLLYHESLKQVQLQKGQSLRRHRVSQQRQDGGWLFLLIC